VFYTITLSKCKPFDSNSNYDRKDKEKMVNLAVLNIYSLQANSIIKNMQKYKLITFNSIKNGRPFENNIGSNI